MERDDARYDVGDVIARGGMGEICTARDERIGREVAIKRMLPEQCDAEAVARFYREAQIQGRLEHPAVVPVHDLGVDANGVPFFVMKRLAGTTLAHCFAEPDKWPRRTLLARFVDVCLAVELAHVRGVVHRDLKPDNIMLGDFGETYVLDWGLARVASERNAPLPDESLEDGRSSMLGTPGYMAPEQITGAPIDGRTDVFGLGALLYEIVAGQPALPTGVPGIEATLEVDGLRPREVEPSVPIELDDAVAAATLRSRDDRPTARQLGERVQAYLDGDRDLARRRELAARHSELAREALGKPGDAARSTAMREAGRALALDPEDQGAQGVLGHLLLEAPAAIPTEALASANAERATLRMRTVRWMVGAYGALFAIMFVLFTFPIRHYAPVIAMILATAMTGALAWNASRRPRAMDDLAYFYTVLGNCVALALGSVVFGPLFLTPTFLVTSLAGGLTQPMKRGPSRILVPHLAALVAPLVLEWIGVLPSSYHVDNGSLTLTPYAIEMTSGATLFLVVIAIGMSVAITSSLLIAQRREQEAMQDRMHAQTWHLRQLLPERRDG